VIKIDETEPNVFPMVDAVVGVKATDKDLEFSSLGSKESRPE
jgi:hypothetical protein